MRIPFLPSILLALIAVVIDIYIYSVARRRCASRVPANIHLILSAVIYVILIVAICLPMRHGNESGLMTKMWLLFIVISILFPKIFFVSADLLASIPKIFHRQRLSWLSIAGGILSMLLFIGMWWGALVNRFRTDIREVEVHVANLPSEFEGYRIAQISDLHVGTYGSDTRYLKEVVKTVNSLEPDLIVFTGDIVNRRTDELVPFADVLSQLYAHDGVYSILGNHDYGDYYNWPSEKAKVLNKQHLIDLQHGMGWRLLLNEHEFIRHGNDSIAIIGVENVGDPPFTVYGDLSRSYPDLSDTNIKILLTHNPVHWQMEIADNDDANVALTLSGHTHAMQMEILGLSPAAFRYDNWGGIYNDTFDMHKLYVNIGIGTVGLPMRMGATPEITLLTLTRKKSNARNH